MEKVESLEELLLPRRRTREPEGRRVMKREVTGVAQLSNRMKGRVERSGGREARKLEKSESG
jgi:hypothetical protein